MKNDVIVSIENLHVNLMTTRGVVCAVRGADLDIKKGEIHGLVGESGCGKTMTSKSILRLHDEKRMLYEGSIKLRDSQGNIKDILQLPMNEVRKMRGSEVSMIFQDPVVSLNPLLTIGNQMVEMLRTHYQDMTKDQAKQKTLKLLDLVGIKPAAERYKQYPFEFSGGMLQRIMIAMALSCDPQLLIADECTTALDVTTQAQMYANVDSIEKTGDWEVTVKLSTPDALWQYVPATTAGHVISQKFYEENKDDFGKPGTGIIGTGPYKFDSWTKDSEIVLSENENYWDKDNNAENAAKTLDYKIITEGTTLVSALQSGQVDLTMGLPTDQIPVIKKNDSLTITESDSFGTDYIAFNTQKAPFDDVNVRKAIYYALDRNQILDNITNGTVSEASASLINEALCTFNENDWKEYLKNVPDYEYNMEKAKEYLAKSSVPDGFECSIVCNQTATQNAEALLLQTALKELNITLNINKVTEDERVSTFMGGDGRNYDMIFCLWFSDFPDPAGNLNSVYPSTAGEEGGANAAVYNNSDVDTWLTEELASSDSTERTELMQKILDKVTDDVPYLVLDHPKVIMVTNSKVVEPKFSAEYQFNLFFKDFNLNK